MIVAPQRENQVLPIERVLPDGSYLSTLYGSTKARRDARRGLDSDERVTVRVIEYEFRGAARGQEQATTYRLLTNWLEPAQAPATELAALYHRRWKIEQALDEIETYLNDSMALCSKAPELVRQEFYALLIAHAAIRRLMVMAAQQTSQAAEDLSFTAAVNVLRRRLPAAGAIPPRQRNSWLASLLDEISRRRCTQSRGKTNPRGVKRKMSNFPLRARGDTLNRKAPRKPKIRHPLSK